MFFVILCYLSCFLICRIIFVNNFAFGPQVDHEVSICVVSNCLLIHLNLH